MGTIDVIQGDITRQAVDAIVNAANESLLGGGGVDGAIHNAAGPELLEECKKVAPCPTGEARITGGYRLPAKYIIHTVGPVWRGGDHGEAELLANCYRHSLSLALRHHIKTIAFPAISTGIFGYPMEAAATVAAEETARFLSSHGEGMHVAFVCFDSKTYKAYADAVRRISER
jgi:O-acetyl-ADP-ribose deacetylase (regulator of RNase III)